jgi:hypothetical protein
VDVDPLVPLAVRDTKMSTDSKDSAEVVEFLTLFAKLKDWIDDDAEILPALASTDESFKALCLELLKAAGSMSCRWSFT